MPIDIIAAKLLIAHLVGDFFLQPLSWVLDKEAKSYKSRFLLYHVLVHFCLMMILVADLNFLPIAMAITVFHFLTDVGKITYNGSYKKLAFVVDQMVHLLFLYLGWKWYTVGNFELSFLQDLSWPILAGLVFVTFPCSIMLKIFIGNWLPEPSTKTGIETAGKWIGIAERLLVFTFVLMGRYEAVGFLLAAKSIFRFGDLNEAKEIQLTEYMLIGSLLSFGMAIFAGIAVKYVLN